MIRFYNRVFDTLFALGIRVAAFVAAFFTVKLILEKDYGPALTTGALSAVLVLMVIAHRRKQRQQVH